MLSQLWSNHYPSGFCKGQKSELSGNMMEVTTSMCHGFLMTMLSAHYNNYVHLSSDEYATTWPLSFQNHIITLMVAYKP